MNKRAMIIINPTAGKEKAPSYEDAIKEQLKDKYPNLVIKHTQGAGDATKFTKEACKNGFDLVVCLGGDGTVNETVNGLASVDNPPMLGIIPLGTVNMLARILSIPIKIEEAIKLLVSDEYKEIDVGLANDKYFTNMLGVGQAAKAVYDVDIDDKTKLGPLAYVSAVGKEILKDDVFTARLEMDEEIWEGEVSVIIVGFINYLSAFKTDLSEEDFGDGMMHIIAIKSLNVAELISMTPAIFFGSIAKSKNIEYFKTKNLKLSTLDNVQYESNIDGDKGPKLPLEIKVFQKHLKVISNKE